MNSIIRSIASAVVLLAISSATASPPAGVSIELESPHGEPSDHVVWRAVQMFSRADAVKPNRNRVATT